MDTAPTGTPAPAAAPLTWDPALESHPLAHFLYDPITWELLRANAAALDRYEYGHEEFVRLNRRDLLVAGEDFRLRAFLDALPQSALQSPQPVWLERTRTGAVLHADIRGLNVLWQGRVARLSAVVDAGPRAQLAADAGRSRDLIQVAGRMAHLGGWSFDVLSGETRWSDVVCALHEVPAGTVSRLGEALAHYPGEAAAQVRAAVIECIRSGTPFDLELPFVGARGTRRWVRVVGEPVRDAAGQVVAIQGAQQDISVHKRDAIALAESRARQAALLSAMPDLWIVFDDEGRYAEVSDAVHRSLSVPWADKLGRRLVDTLDPPLAQRMQALMESARDSGQPVSHHYDMRVVRGQSGAEGELRSFEARYVPLSGGRTLALIRDVTETVQLEGRFHAMADAAPIAIYMTDPTGSCTYTNAAWQALYALDGEASLGRGWAARLHPADRARVFAELNAASAARRSCELEFRICLDAGLTRTIVATSRPIERPDGSLLGFVGTVSDVTQARELQAAREARAVAEEAERRQSAFMSRVSHELRTPLNAILGFGELLQQDLGPPGSRPAVYLGHVVTAGRHMLALVDDLLELQRIEQGRLNPVMQTVVVADLLAATVQMLSPLAETAGVTLRAQSTPGLVVHSDERCLKQILLNLGSNAIKYGGRGSVVRLDALATATALQLTVADNGPGMTAEQLQRLFNPFERLGQETNAVAGSGLGLVISRQLAQALGGQLQIASQPGAGTTACLEVPRVPA